MTKNFCDKCGGALQPNGVFRVDIHIGTTAFRTVESTPMGLNHVWMYCQGCFDEVIEQQVGKPLKVWREPTGEYFPLRLFS
jgi:hypothetical protein